MSSYYKVQVIDEAREWKGKLRELFCQMIKSGVVIFQELLQLELEAGQEALVTYENAHPEWQHAYQVWWRQGLHCITKLDFEPRTFGFVFVTDTLFPDSFLPNSP